MFCRKCGKQIPDNSNACQYCGAMLTRTPVNSTYNPINTNYRPPVQPQPIMQPQPTYQAVQPMQLKKKSPWKVIVPIVAVVLVIVIVISVIFGVGAKKNEDKKRLMQVLEASTDKPVVEFIHEDFDSDGTTEAYVVVGESVQKNEYTEYYDADIYYVNHAKAQVIKENVSGHSNGTMEINDTIYVSFEVYDEDSDKGVSFVYTSEENEPVESDISGEYSDVRQDDGKILANDDDGDEIVIETVDGNSYDADEEAEQSDGISGWMDDTFGKFEDFAGNVTQTFDNIFNNEDYFAYLWAHKVVCGLMQSDLFWYIFEGDGSTWFEAEYTNDDGTYHHDPEDPLGKFEDEYVYIRCYAGDIDWIVQNVFNLQPDRTFSTNDCYYYGDYFYVRGNRNSSNY